MKTFKNILEELAIAGGNLATFDAPISNTLQRRKSFMGSEIHDVDNLASILHNKSGEKKKHERWSKTLKHEPDSAVSNIKKSFNRKDKKDIILNHENSNTMIFLGKKKSNIIKADRK